MKARITELELQLDVTKAEGDAKEKQLRGEHADSLMEWQQKVEHLQNDVKKTTALRDTARSEVILLADELSVLKHQSNVNAEFSLSRQKEMGRANDTLRSSLDSVIKEEASIKRRTQSLQTKAENYNSELAKRNEELVEIIEKLKSEHEGALSARQMRIDSLEEMLRVPVFTSRDEDNIFTRSRSRNRASTKGPEGRKGRARRYKGSESTVVLGYSRQQA